MYPILNTRKWATLFSFISATLTFGALGHVFAADEPKVPPVARVLKTDAGPGEFHVSPDFGIAGEWGTWIITYRVGAQGIARGGGIRVQLPDTWHSGARNSANRLQATDPTDNHHVSSTCSRSDVRLRTIVEAETPRKLVKHGKPSLDGRLERYVFVVRVVVAAGSLAAGDQIQVVYGDRRGGGRGMLAGVVAAGPEPVLVALDSAGTGEFRLHARRDVLMECLPGPAVEMLLHLPSSAVVNERVTGHVALVDREKNPVAHSAEVHLELTQGHAAFPATVEIEPDRGYATFSLDAQSVDVIRLSAEAHTRGLAATSNPLEVTPGIGSRERLFWGDLHSHTHYSWDGVGNDAFRYARRVSGLDFYAMTDHSRAPQDGVTRGLGHHNWEAYKKATDNHNAPGEFVTLHAYECSMGRPYGHHNVFFRDRPGPLYYPSKSTLPQLWRALSAGQALTIPHHTGKFPAGVLFRPQDDMLRRNFEIYSGHGLSEAYDPKHPLAFEHSLFTSDSKSLRESTFAQDVWRQGILLSTIAASDDHRAQPGQPHYGLVAVRAHELTRDGIFQALFDRRTYATTGAKIILEFSVGGHPMGSTVSLSKPPKVRVRAIGTDTIAWVEVLRLDERDGEFDVIQRWEPRRAEFEGAFVDESYRPGSVYYTRLQQARDIRERAVMAWSTPVWTMLLNDVER